MHVRWGMIGCGSVTERKSAPAYSRTQGFSLQGVCGRTHAKAVDYARRHEVPKVFRSVAELIEADEIDAVYIATPPDSHEALALAVAAAGKPCCIEKPLAPSHAACERIRRAFEDRNLPLFVAYYRRSLPRFRRVRELLDSMTIGTVRHLHWALHRPGRPAEHNFDDDWRVDPGVAPGGYFDDLASHGIDLFHWLLGQITEAKGIAVNQQGLYAAADAVAGCWTHNSHVLGSGSWNFGANDRFDRVEITGSEGKMTFSMFEEEPIRIETHQTVWEEFVDNPSIIQLPHVEAMQGSLINGTAHPSTGTSASHTAWVMDCLRPPKFRAPLSNTVPGR